MRIQNGLRVVILNVDPARIGVDVPRVRRTSANKLAEFRVQPQALFIVIFVDGRFLAFVNEVTIFIDPGDWRDDDRDVGLIAQMIGELSIVRFVAEEVEATSAIIVLIRRIGDRIVAV
jgi:hypothetical protein